MMEEKFCLKAEPLDGSVPVLSALWAVGPVKGYEAAREKMPDALKPEFDQAVREIAFVEQTVSTLNSFSFRAGIGTKMTFDDSAGNVVSLEIVEMEVISNRQWGGIILKIKYKKLAN